MVELGLEPSEDGKALIEIDESKIIGNANSVIWMFGLIDRSDKQARVYCFMNDRICNRLLDIIKKYITILMIFKRLFIAIALCRIR